jgi:hypothetical protein
VRLERALGANGHVTACAEKVLALVHVLVARLQPPPKAGQLAHQLNRDGLKPE